MPLKNTIALICLTLLWTSGSPVSWANMEPIPPFMGDWEGGWVEAPKKDGNAKNNPGLVARVIGVGNDRYEIQIMEEFDKRADFKVKTEAVWKNGKITFDQNGYSGTITADSFTGKKAGGAFETPFSLKRTHRTAPSLGAKAPANAVVLFDGSNLDAWERQNGEEPTWLVENGHFEVLPKKDNKGVGGSINTRRSFGDVKVHLEFRLPYEPEHRGQKRANSGFFLPGGYEVQILDSYGLGGMWNECGALYKQSPPRVNMCWAPGVWQTYDVEFKRLRRDSEGNKVDHAEFTVWHNGVKIHNSFQIKGPTANTQKGRGQAESGENGGLSLQDHSNKIQFRNIWVMEQ